MVVANSFGLPLGPLDKWDGDVLLKDVSQVGHDHKGCCR